MDFKKVLKVVGPILLLAIPAIIIIAIFSDSHYGANAGEYEPEGEVIYRLSQQEEHSATGEEELESGTP